MTDSQTIFDAMAARLTARPDVERKKLFGSPCLQVSGNTFLTFHREFIAVKLAPDDRAAALQLSGATLWDPGARGRPKKEWVVIPFEQAAQWNHYADAALAYVATLPPK